MTFDRASRPLPGHSRRGFTLIEVLIAAFVIALGVLGLLALFAGAARQQQAATQTTRSVFFSNSAAALLAGNLGRLQGGAVSTPDGVWMPVMMDRRYFILTTAPTQNTCSSAPFFLTTAPSSFLFTASDPRTAQGNPGFTTPMDKQNGPFITMSPLSGRQFEPASLEFLADIRDFLTPGVPKRSMRFFRQPNANYSSFGLDQGGRLFVYPAKGTTVKNKNFILVDVQPCSVPVSQRRNAEIVQLSIAEPDLPFSFFDPGIRPTEFISSIKLVRGQRRNQELVSLNDRILTRPDPAADSGERPELSYSLLRRTSGSVTQIILFTYQLTPPTGSARWIPREREQDFNLDNFGKFSSKKSPLRQTELDLVYDLGQRRYFLEAPASKTDVLWALAPGQILIVPGIEVISGNSNAKPGSDAPVRVIRQQRLTTNGQTTIRAFLDRGPRTLGSSYLTGKEREDGTPKKLTVIGVNDIATSIDGNSEWALRALAARVIQISTN